MEVIKEALIIEANGLRTTAFVIENLPKNLIFQKTKKLMPKDEYSEQLVPAFTRNDRNERIPTGEMVDSFIPGIQLDGAGSGGYIFERDTDDSVQRLKAIDKYIEDTILDPALRSRREPYAQQVGEKNSNPKPYHTIVRVKLPVPASPPVAPTTEQVRPSPVLEKPKKVKTPEQVAAMKARLEKARAARAVKAEVKPVE